MVILPMQSNVGLFCFSSPQLYHEFSSVAVKLALKEEPSTGKRRGKHRADKGLLLTAKGCGCTGLIMVFNEVHRMSKLLPRAACNVSPELVQVPPTLKMVKRAACNVSPELVQVPS